MTSEACQRPGLSEISVRIPLCFETTLPERYEIGAVKQDQVQSIYIY